MSRLEIEKDLMKDLVQWDVGTWSAAIRFWEDAIDWRNRGRKCLELGAGKGGLSLWLALKGQTVICSNVTDTETRASELHKKYGVSSCIRYENIDATDIPYENHFDFIVFKSMLGTVGRNKNKARQQAAIDEILKALRPGGRLLFAENLCGTLLHKWARERFVRWGTAWRWVSISEIKEFFKAYSSCQVQTAGVIAVFGRTERQRRILSVLDHVVLNRLCPATWTYMIYGIATKGGEIEKRSVGHAEGRVRAFT